MIRNKRENAWFEKRREEYCQLIRDVFDEYQQVLGAEKIQTILVQRGHQVSKEYVSRLMSEMGLRSVRMTAKKEYLKLREPERKKNFLQQQFTADQPNQRWVSDVSCFKIGDHYLYVCVIIDLFSRKVIAYKISKKNSTQLITAAFKIAYEERNPPTALIFHSDRGAQYTSHRFQQLLHEHKVQQSFSRPGEPYVPYKIGKLQIQGFSEPITSKKIKQSYHITQKAARSRPRAAFLRGKLGRRQKFSKK